MEKISLCTLFIKMSATFDPKIDHDNDLSANSFLKFIIPELMANKRDNDHQIIYGRNPVLEALESGKSFERIYLKDSISGPFEKDIRAICKERDIPLKKVPQVKLDKLTWKKNHQGIVGVGSIITYQEIEHVLPHLYEQGIDPVIFLLDNVQDVRNIGAIARSLEALGGHLLILSGKNAGMVTQDALKTSAGALTRISVCRAKNTIATIEELSNYGISSYATSLTPTDTLDKLSPKPPICIVLGSEGEGLHRSVISACAGSFMIGQKGESDSLNVSVAAGIILYQISINAD